MPDSMELMLGNWFKDHTRANDFVEIKSLDKGDRKVKVADILLGYVYDSDLDNLRPIKLSYSILLACGFEYRKFDIDCNDPHDAYWNHPDMEFAINNLSWGVQKIRVRLTYLHQLQNLFYILTNKQLNFKP